MIEPILQRFARGEDLTREDLCALLRVPVGSRDYYRLLSEANAYSRRAFDGKGLLFGQIGLDIQPCRINCKFCSLAADVLKDCVPVVRDLHSTAQLARELAESGAQDVFLMTTAEFSQERFLEYGRAVRSVLPDGVRLVANVGDFSEAYARRLRETGFTGIYHICRLGEGVDTGAAVETRLRTMDAVKAAGLELYYCVEPIGPEHTNEQLAEEMLRPRQYPVGVMAVMKRTAVPGTALAKRGEISAARLAQICAAATLAMRPKRAMCVHEPDELCLMAGANQLYAECGANPRDTEAETSKGRGFSAAEVQAMLRKTEWELTE